MNYKLHYDIHEQVKKLMQQEHDWRALGQKYPIAELTVLSQKTHDLLLAIYRITQPGHQHYPIYRACLQMQAAAENILKSIPKEELPALLSQPKCTEEAKVIAEKLREMESK